MSEDPSSTAESERLMEKVKICDDFFEEHYSFPLSHQRATETRSLGSLSSCSVPAQPSLTVTDSPAGGGGEEEDKSTADAQRSSPATGPTNRQGVQMEGGESLDIVQDSKLDQTEVPETVEKGGEKEEEQEVEEAVEALELEAGGGEHPETLDLEVPEVRVQDELEDEGHGVEIVEKTEMLDDLAKRIQVEEFTPAAGLVSILKRRVSPEGTNSNTATPKPVSKRKVRFRVPDDSLDHDEVGGDSWLLLLLLCLATVVISVGGTALYCTFGDAQSSVCTDFSHNMDFYVSQVQRGVDELRHWLTRGS